MSLTRRTLCALAIAASGLLPLGLLALPGDAPAPAQAAAPEPQRIDAIPAEQPSQLAPAPDPLDLAFLADLLGPDADLTEEEARHWTELGRRFCETTGNPALPGAEQQTRESWLAGLTDPRVGALQPWEAEKLLDTATAAYCPELLQAPAPAAPAPQEAAQPAPAAPAPAQAAEQPAAAPAAEPAAPAAEEPPACPGTTEWQGEELGCVQPQLPDEAIGGARCGDGDELIARLPDGSLGCAPSGI